MAPPPDKPMLLAIEPDVLINMARQVLGSDTATVLEWQTRQFHGAGAGSTIYRVTGDARVADSQVPWSLIVKVFDHGREGLEAASTDPAAWDYWRREWLAYQSPYLAELPGGVAGPRCLGIGEREDIAWVALEDLSGLDARPWPLAHFRTAARHLGAFNGAYTTGRPIPRDPWLSRGWLRGWTGRAESMVARLPSLADHAVVRQVLSPAMITSLIALWADRTAFFNALDALPQTLCHRDAFPRNLFVRPTQDGDQLVAVDWAFIGSGALGEEMAPLVGASLTFLQADPARADELEQACLTAYVAGLQDAGWQGQRDDVWFGYQAALVLRFALGTLAPSLTVVLDEALHPWAEQVFGYPWPELLRQWRAVNDFSQQRIVQARRLLAAR